jgi:D-alanyl-D-alanine carboxypeptidase
MTERPRIEFSGGTRRRRRHRREGPVRRRSLARLLGAVVAIGMLLVALGAVLEPVSIHDLDTQEERSPDASRFAPPAAVAGSRANASFRDRRFDIDLSGADVVRLRFVRKPRAGIAFDLRTGRVLWRRNPKRRLPIASLTKMMTALVIAEGQDPHDRVRITKKAVTTAGSGVGVLPKGKKVQLEALMNGLLLVSGNDASVALAEHAAGSVGRFVRLMNRRAAELGLKCTRFTTPHGLEDENNHSCAADLAILARADLAQRRIRRIARRDRAIVKFPIKGGRLFLYNNNPLIRSGYPGATGLKTGYTERAGRSIVATAKRGKRSVGVVLLRSHNPAEQARKLLDRSFKALLAGR